MPDSTEKIQAVPGKAIQRKKSGIYSADGSANKQIGLKSIFQ